MNCTRFARLAAIAGLMLLAAELSAQTMEEAGTAYAEGRFLEAADLAEAVGTSDAYALAAKSVAIIRTLPGARGGAAGVVRTRG